MEESEDILERYEKKVKEVKQEDPKIQKKIHEVYEVENRLAILLAINNFGSLNIKKLAKILGKNEATIYYHLKFLKTEPKLISSDTQKTDANRGIYYELTPLAERYFSDKIINEENPGIIEAFDKILQADNAKITQLFTEFVSKNPDLGQIAKRDRMRITYNHIMENIMLNNLEQAELAYMSGQTPENSKYPFGSLSNWNLTMNISEPRHHFEIVKLLAEFSVKFHTLRKRIETEMIHDKIKEKEQIQYQLNMVGGEITQFTFK